MIFECYVQDPITMGRMHLIRISWNYDKYHATTLLDVNCYIIAYCTHI